MTFVLLGTGMIPRRPGARRTLFGCLNFSWYDSKRKRARYKQAGRGGVGSVFAHKGVKALVARWDAGISIETRTRTRLSMISTFSRQSRSRPSRCIRGTRR